MVFLVILGLLGCILCCIMLIVSAIKGNGKVKKWGIGIIACLIVAVMANIPKEGAQITLKQSIPEAAETTTKVTEKTKTWQRVTEFRGNSIKTTKKFTIDSDEWKIKWSTAPGEYGDMNFQIYLYDTNGNLAGSGVLANIIGRGNDESYIYESGEYYLMINTAQNYNITIEQNK